jgi:hypothetical protein
MNTSEKFDKILGSLQDVKRAEPNPFFTGRVIQKFKDVSKRSDSSWLNFGWAFSLLVLLIAFNLIIFFTQFRSGNQTISDWKSTTPDWVVDYTENPGTSVYGSLNK